MSDSDEPDVAERLLALLEKLDILTARSNQVERDSRAWESFASRFRSLVDRRGNGVAPGVEDDRGHPPA